MSTSSTIAVRTNRGVYKAIYCHNDGYPSYMYPMLRDWYGTPERAEALVNYGDASSIAKRILPSPGSVHSFDHPEKDVCIFYHRDRGEGFYCSFYRDEVAVQNSQYYTYIFEGGAWHVYIGGKEADDYSNFDD